MFHICCRALQELVAILAAIVLVPIVTLHYVSTQLLSNWKLHQVRIGDMVRITQFGDVEEYLIISKSNASYWVACFDIACIDNGVVTGVELNMTTMVLTRFFDHKIRIERLPWDRTEQLMKCDEGSVDVFDARSFHRPKVMLSLIVRRRFDIPAK